MLGMFGKLESEILWGSEEKIVEEILVGAWKLVLRSLTEVYSTTQLIWNS